MFISQQNVHKEVPIAPAVQEVESEALAQAHANFRTRMLSSQGKPWWLGLGSGVGVSTSGFSSEGWQFRSTPQGSADHQVLSKHGKQDGVCGRAFSKRGLFSPGHLEGDSICAFLG